MKKFILVFSFIIGITTSLVAQTVVENLVGYKHDDFKNNAWVSADSSVYYYNNSHARTASLSIQNSATNGWTNWYKHSYTITPSNKISENIRENWNGTAWVNFTRYKYSFDANDNNTLVEYDTWNGSNWNTTGKIEYIGYNAQGQYAEEILSNYVGGNWVGFLKNEYTYTFSTNKLASSAKYTWLNNVWKKNERLLYTYLQDSIETITRAVSDATNNWVNESKTTRTYTQTPAMLLMQNLKQVWDTISLNYVNHSRNVFAYNVDSLPTEILAENAFGPTAWNTVFKTLLAYNSSKQLIDSSTEWNVNNVWENNVRKTLAYAGNNISEEKLFTGNGSSWNDAKRTSFLYNSNNYKIFEQVDSFLNGNYKESYRNFYHYSQYPTAVTSNNSSLQNVKIYPNPAKSNLQIEVESNEAFPASVYVVDILGSTKQIITQPIFSGKNTIVLNVSQLKSGIYFVVLNNRNNNTKNQQVFTVE